MTSSALPDSGTAIATAARPSVGGSVIRIRGLRHAYGDGVTRKQVLHDVDLDIGGGEIVLLTGPSGSGKTTLLTLIGGLRAVQSGSCQVLGQELAGAAPATMNDVRRHVGYIFQASNLLPFLNARENVEMTLALDPNRSREERRRLAEAMLAEVGLTPEAAQKPSTLSGGQKQRVAIARALAHEPRLILADEPTAALDKHTGHDVVDLMRRLAKERHVPVLIVTHDSRILDVADRILRFEDGRVVV